MTRFYFDEKEEIMKPVPDLSQILEAERERRTEDGIYGITACKKSIRSRMEYEKKPLVDLLIEYQERAYRDPFFNKAMILACWEMMHEPKH